ncbi:MAG: signal peptide peptidase SppA [Roseiflexus sp.]|nr:signal peptide peptidase SppA [Roseiflexus sp.]MCS7288639.1 signal peptide peptidase SppA [Roseiflexus sp.]MDW8146457.1 signal peptide peptidase SppA [Roseiflexaceae bacterium]MDW8234389.1 signal peptide peptidase SppA [Roseiflexaceae bacterium]
MSNEALTPSSTSPAKPAPRKDRTWIIVISIILGIVLACAILPLGGVALLLAFGGGDAAAVPGSKWREEVISGRGTDRIVIITVSGTIGAGADDGLFSAGLSHEQLLSQIRTAAEDSRVKAVVLRVDSPGGSVVASNELYVELKKLREKGKRLVISMGPIAASGGYYISMAGERIYANPDTLTGSLGVIVSLLNYDEAFERLGLREYVYKSGDFKDIGSPLRPPRPEEEAIWKALVDEAYQGFVDVIVEGRGMERSEVIRLADGRIYTGRQAKALGLIDELGNLEDAIEGAKELAGLTDALIVRYRSSNTLRELLQANLERNLQPADPLGLRSIVPPHAPRLEYRFVP